MTWRSPRVWRWVGLATFVGSIILWIAAEAFGFIGDTVFIGRMSMLALVFTGLAAWRADENPTPDEEMPDEDDSSWRIVSSENAIPGGLYPRGGVQGDSEADG